MYTDLKRFFLAVAAALLGCVAIMAWVLREPPQHYLATGLMFAVASFIFFGCLIWSYVKTWQMDGHDVAVLLKDFVEALVHLGVLCLFGHAWESSCCRRCGKNRKSSEADRYQGGRFQSGPIADDGEHVWEKHRCVKCGLVDPKQHDWYQCTCTVCGATRHEWHEGKCRLCRESCPHPETLATWKVFKAAQTVQAVKINHCTICGAAASIVCESPPRAAPPAETSPPKSISPAVVGILARDPLWLEVRRSWLALDHQSAAFREPEREIRRESEAGEMPSRARLHEEALQTLVQLGELNKAVAADLHRVYWAALEDMYRSMATCYLRGPPHPNYPQNIRSQGVALREMARKGDLDRAVVARAQACIARDVERSQGGWLPAWLIHHFPSTTSQDVARILVALLSQGDDSGKP